MCPYLEVGITYQVPPYTTEGIDDGYAQPADGTLYLDANVELDRDDNKDVNHTQVEIGGGKVAPELLWVGFEGIWLLRHCINVFTDQCSVETTDVFKTVDLSQNYK